MLTVAARRSMHCHYKVRLKNKLINQSLSVLSVFQFDDQDRRQGCVSIGTTAVVLLTVIQSGIEFMSYNLSVVCFLTKLSVWSFLGQRKCKVIVFLLITWIRAPSCGATTPRDFMWRSRDVITRHAWCHHDVTRMASTPQQLKGPKHILSWSKHISGYYISCDIISQRRVVCRESTGEVSRL